jgi:endonuclease YncB( thermonuclease family)
MDDLSCRNGKAYGNNVKHAASELAFGKEVTLQTHDLDKYGRTLADVFLSDGTNVNQELVKQGWCWWYRKYAPGNVALEGLEHEARQAKKARADRSWCCCGVEKEAGVSTEEKIAPMLTPPSGALKMG